MSKGEKNNLKEVHKRTWEECKTCIEINKI